jgi:hypothetical protein
MRGRKRGLMADHVDIYRKLNINEVEDSAAIYRV